MTDLPTWTGPVEEYDKRQLDKMTYQKEEHPDVEMNVGGIRDFIYRITQEDAGSPISECEIEEIARCAVRGGYKLDVDAFTSAYGRFVLGLPIN